MCFAVLAGWLSMATDVRIVQLRASAVYWESDGWVLRARTVEVEEAGRGIERGAVTGESAI